MTKEEIYSGLNETFQDIFDDDSIVVDETTTADDIEDWDSLEHINLVVAIESRFNIKFNIGKVSSMKNVGDMVNIILSRV